MLQGIGICVRINPWVVHYQNILHAVAKYLEPNPVMTAIHICGTGQMISTSLALLPAGWKNSGHHLFLGNQMINALQ